jgi:hypothetical protein
VEPASGHAVGWGAVSRCFSGAPRFAGPGVSQPGDEPAQQPEGSFGPQVSYNDECPSSGAAAALVARFAAVDGMIMAQSLKARQCQDVVSPAWCTACSCSFRSAGHQT